MAEQNDLHNIKIDDLDNKSKKTPLKNILTLLALLFIILVISVVITRLILNTDEDGENNSTVSTSTTEKNDTGINATHAIAAAGTAAAVAATLNSDKKEPSHSTTNSSESKNSDEKKKEAIKQTNSGSKINVKLTDRQAPKKVQQLITPTKKHISKKVVTHVKKKVITKKHTKKAVTHYKDKVIARRTSSSKKSKSTGHYVTRLPKGYHIKVGAFSDISKAIKSIKKTRLNYELIKIKNGKNMTRVLVGPFKTEKSAEIQLRKIKHIASGAYIIRVK